MVKIEKLPSGNYRARVQYHDAAGARHYKSITAPTRKDAQLLAAQFEADESIRRADLPHMTVADMLEKYIESKKNVLSPKTYREYNGIARNFFPSLLSMDINDLTQENVQIAVNEEALKNSPKTVRNKYGLY